MPNTTPALAKTVFTAIKLLARRIAASALLVLAASAAYAAAPFVDNNDGTVTDTVTGLMWDQCSLGQTQGANTCTGSTTRLTWATAMVQGGSTIYKGYTDWRLPSITELRTLVKTGSSPTIDSTVFPQTEVFNYWSSTPYAPYPSSAWVVNFGNGNTDAALKAYADYVRLVRSGQSFGPFGLTQARLSAITTAGGTLTATSPVAATGRWLVVARNAPAPNAPQVVAGINYGSPATPVVAYGSAAMAAKAASSLSISGLAAATDYDLYAVAVDTIAAAQTSSVTGPLAFTTLPTPVIATSAIVIDPATPATLYAALDGGGVYKSVNSGGSWSPATTQPSNLRTRALVIQPGASANLFAASYGSGVFKSTDSGGAWTACATQPANQNVLSLQMNASGTLYAGTEAGVFTSTDSCATWTAMNTGLP